MYTYPTLKILYTSILKQLSCIFGIVFLLAVDVMIANDALQVAIRAANDARAAEVHDVLLAEGQKDRLQNGDWKKTIWKIGRVV
jgi:hypothetical protein